MERISKPCYGGNWGSRYTIYLDYTLNSQSITNNASNITLRLWARASASNYRAYNLNNVNPYNLKINGSNKASGKKSMDFRGRAIVELGSWTGNVSHKSDGTLTIEIDGSFSIIGVSSLSGGSISKTWTLPTIPRYAKITSFSIKNQTCIKFGMYYSVDRSVDSVQISLNGNTWQNKPSDNWIRDLSPGTKYTLRIRVRSAASGLWTYSSTLSITTYGLSNSNDPNFNTDGSLTIDISRKSSSMYHDLYLYFWHDDQRWEQIASITNVTTQGTFNFTSTQLNNIYNNRIYSNKSNTKLEIISKWGSNGTVQGSKNEYGELTIVNANPSISSVSYKDYNTNVQAVLNNDQLILRNKSYLEVTAGTATSQKGATLKSYKLSIGGSEYSVTATGTSQSGRKLSWGPLNQSSNQTAVLTVIDSRGNKASRSFTIQVINYYEPQPVNYSADRLNNYEEPSYINAELRRSVVNVGGADINELYIRYQVGALGTFFDIIGQNSHKSGIWQNVNVEEYIGDYPNDKSFNIYLEIKDKFTNWITITFDLPEGIALWSYYKDKMEAGVPIVLQSPDGSKFKIKVDNNGNLSTEATY